MLTVVGLGGGMFLLWLLIIFLTRSGNDPLMVAIPLSTANMSGVSIPLSLPRGSYYLQIAFLEEDIVSFLDVRISGSIKLKMKELERHYDVNLLLSPDTIRDLIDASHFHTEVAIHSKRGDKLLPWPWTINTSNILSEPIFPPFRIGNVREVIFLFVDLQIQSTSGTDHRVNESEHGIYIKIDTFIDAI